jgi:hypothetical protein
MMLCASSGMVGSIPMRFRHGKMLSAVSPASGIVAGMTGAHVLHWNGKDLPEELRELPAGTYIVEAVDKAPTLTHEEERGLAEALGSLRAGKGRTIDEVRNTIGSILHR